MLLPECKRDDDKLSLAACQQTPPPPVGSSSSFAQLSLGFWTCVRLRQWKGHSLLEQRVGLTCHR